MSELYVVTFTFPSVKVLRSSIKYLCVQGGALKIVVSCTSHTSEARLTRSDVRQHSYSEIVIKTPNNLIMGKSSTIESSSDENEFAWEVDGQVLLKSMRLFEGYESLIVELALDLTSMFIRTEDGERWAQIGVLHSLGPLLNIEHDVDTLHEISDVEAFCHIVKFVATSQEATCAINLRFDSLQSFMELKTEGAAAHVLIDSKNLFRQAEGCAQTLELVAFAELASQMGKDVHLFLGFGINGLAMFKLEWPSFSCENSVAYLYFCIN